MLIAAILTASIHARQDIQPVFWLKPNGDITIEGKIVSPIFSPGTRKVRADGGYAYDFNGQRSGILLGDAPPLVITDSITVSVWVNLRSYVNDGPGAQILFRGDDRCGLDPYTLSVWGDGTVNFFIQNSEDRAAHIGVEVPLNRWTQIIANYEARTGKIQMWMNNEYVGLVKTSVVPFAALDNGWTPGVSIGNVQNEKGPHNQPLNGQVADLRIYKGAYSPDEITIPSPNRVNPPFN